MLLRSPTMKKDIINNVLKWRIWILLITFIIRFGRCKQFIRNTWITNSLLTFKEVYSSYCFSLLVSTTCFWVFFFFYYLQDWIRVCADEHCLANTGSSDSRSRRLSNNEANYTCADKYIMNDFFLCLLATLCSVPATLELPNAVSLICHKLSHQNHWPDTTTLKQQTLWLFLFWIWSNQFSSLFYCLWD